MKAAGSWVALLALLLLVGCGASDSPVAGRVDRRDRPAATPQSSISGTGNRVLWGLWKIGISADRSTVDVVPERAAAMHLNVVRLLEYAPCHDCLRVENVAFNPPDELAADLTLIHPFPDRPQYTGFDVRGIFISGTGYTFPLSGKSIAWGDDSPRMLNPDGYTALFNPTEFPETTPPILGYIPGHRATGGDLSATLNPFVAYSVEQPRRMFESGSQETRRVRLRIPPGELEFGYAIDACWQLVEGEITDPVVDFPPDANCLEAYEISVWAGPGLSLDPGAWTWVYATVYDHQGRETIAEVTAEAPDVFAGAAELSFHQELGDGGCLYKGSVMNDKGAGTGDYPLLVRVVDTETDQNLGPVDAWFVGSLPVRKGWVLTWGGELNDQGHGIGVDEAGNIYVLSEFSATVDLDPTPGTSVHDAEVYGRMAVSKFDWGGGFEWVRTWEYLWAHVNNRPRFAVDSKGNSYLTSRYGGTVDFDPGPGIEERTANEGDLYLVKLNSSGELVWVTTWEEEDEELRPGCVTADDASGVCIGGRFEGAFDFDPGPDIDERFSIADQYDAFVINMDTDGGYQWARTWGGGVRTDAMGVALDASAAVYVAGRFKGIVDFDPGPGEDIYDSEGLTGIYLSKFDSSGHFQWAAIWTGGADPQSGGPRIAVDPGGNIYVADIFYLQVDLDPGPGLDVHVSNGGDDVFLSKFNPSGDYLWGRSWGGISSEEVNAILVDNSDDVLVLGGFECTVDFDPGPGVDERVADYEASFLSKFDSAGDYLAVSTWGVREWHYNLRQIAGDHFSNVYITDAFRGVWDFDPGPGTEFREATPSTINPINDFSDVYLLKIPPDGNWW